MIDRAGPPDHETDPGADPDRRNPPAGAPAEPAVCSYCGDRFVGDELLALHRGLEHEGLTADEREAYVDALEAEREDLRLFRLKALAGLLALYFGFIYVYAFAL